MPGHFKNRQKELHDRLIGLGPESMQKSYYPELMSKVQELKRFRDMLDHINDLILLVDLPDGRIFDMNETATSVLGYTAEELRRSSLADIFEPQMLEEINSCLSSQGDRGKVLDVELITRERQRISAQLTCSVVREKHEHVGILIVRDVTEAVRARDAFVRQRIYFSQLFANAPVGIVLLDKNSLVLDVNEFFEKMFGYGREEVVGQDLDSVLAPDELHEQARKFTNKVDSGERVAGEVKRKCKDGTLLQVRIQGFPIYIRDQVSGVIGLYEDITEKKRLEQELVKSEKLESIALLAGGIAHDFNNLLAGIMANISLVRFYEQSNKQVLSVLTKAENACLRARDMTQQLLTFSKGGEPVRKVFHWEEPLRQTVEFSLTGSDVSCSLDIDDNLRPLQADLGQINQVVQNLVINAVQAMPGGGELIIRAENADIGEDTVLPLEPGRYVLLLVRDNGVGISTEEQERIFDPYFSTKQGGSGLGLAIVFSIVQKHGGWVKVSSERGRGTDFYVYLPAGETEEALDEEERSEGLTSEWEKASVLFMDDEQELAEVTTSLLDEMGYEVVSVPDGQKAIEEYCRAFFKGDKFDVLIMDLTIPGNMGGREALQKILEVDPEVQAVASSGYSSDPVMSRFSDFGFKAALVKPYKIEELDAVIQELVRGKK